MRPIIPVAALLAAMAGCASVGVQNPAGLRAHSPVASLEGAGEQAAAALCLVHGLEREGSGFGIQASTRPSPDASVPEVIGRMDGDALVVMDVRQPAPGRLRVDYYLEKGLVFKGFLEARIRRAILGCFA